ncbi:MAG: hypothetical protein FWH07_08365 [Oscillospiraceae bacterium]|nr:hypothetical protein [Oscillospiraceae bacterium]
MQFSASSNVIPHAIDEFKPPELSKQCLNDLRTHFRNAWDFTIGTRHRPDLTSQKYELLVLIVVAGEQYTNDAAIRERV